MRLSLCFAVENHCAVLASRDLLCFNTYLIKALASTVNLDCLLVPAQHLAACPVDQHAIAIFDLSLQLRLDIVHERMYFLRISTHV